MSREKARLRMFAGPNGSGKSVLKSYLPESLLGVYLNPDEIEASIKEHGYAEMRTFEVHTTKDEILPLFTRSDLLAQQKLAEAAGSLSFADDRLYFPPATINSYFASVLADFLRQKLLAARRDFTFETVM